MINRSLKARNSTSASASYFGRPLMLALFLLLPVLAVACGEGERTAAGYENVEVAHVYKHWRQGAKAEIPFMILDVRTPAEYAEGHIAGATLIPVQELANRLSEVPKDRQVYVHCKSGRRSARAAKLLAENGFDRIENMLGGIIAWQDAGYPVVK